MSTDTADLILHAIETLRTDLQTLREEVRAGFDKVNGRLGKLEGRVTSVERWQAEHDAANRAIEEDHRKDHQAKTLRFTGAQVLLAVVSAICATGAVAGFYLQLVTR
jgi:hypothetical protein